MCVFLDFKFRYERKRINNVGEGLLILFFAFIAWGIYSTIVKKIGEWDYPTVEVTKRIHF